MPIISQIVQTLAIRGILHPVMRAIPGNDAAARSLSSALQFPQCQGQNSQPGTAT